MNESVSYDKAVSIALSPENISQANTLWTEISPVLLLVMFTPTILFLFMSGLFSIFEKNPMKKLWKNENFWLVTVFMVFVQAIIFLVVPRLF